MPNRKVGAGALAGALSIVIVFVIQQFGVQLTGEISSALTTIITFITSYVVPEPANGIELPK